MQIIEERKEHSITLTLSGRLDVNASSQLENEISNYINSAVIDRLILDMAGVEYISSAGIRVLLSAQKKLGKSNELVIRNPSKFCKDVFNVTGADIFLKIV